MGSIPSLIKFPGEGNGNPLQYSCLGHPTDRGAWQAYSTWGCKRVRHDLATEQQRMNTHFPGSPIIAVTLSGWYDPVLFLYDQTPLPLPEQRT